MRNTEGISSSAGPNKAQIKKLGLVNIRVIQYDRVKSDGTSPLYLQIRQGKKQVRIPLQISISPDQFDAHRQRLKPTTKRAKELNLTIDNILSRCTQIQTDYFLRKADLTPDTLKEELLNEKSRLSFIEYWRSEMEKLLERGSIKHSTKKSESESLTRLIGFQKAVSFFEITPHWLDEYEGHLRRTMGLKESTIHKTIKHMRKYVKRAIESGIRLDDPFKVYSLPAESATKIIWLTMAEVHKLNDLYQSDFCSPSLARTLRPFLFACFTGIRSSDYHQVNADNIHGDILQFIPVKTARFQRYVRIPLSEKSRIYLDEDQSLGDLLSQQRMNDILKEAAKICGIRKTLTTHVARHTFASNWIMAGRNVVALQRILGHAKIDQTMQYVHLHSRDLQSEMNAFNEWI